MVVTLSFHVEEQQHRTLDTVGTAQLSYEVLTGNLKSLPCLSIYAKGSTARITPDDSDMCSFQNDRLIVMSCDDSMSARLFRLPLELSISDERCLLEWRQFCSTVTHSFKNYWSSLISDVAPSLVDKPNHSLTPTVGVINLLSSDLSSQLNPDSSRLTDKNCDHTQELKCKFGKGVDSDLIDGNGDLSENPTAVSGVSSDNVFTKKKRATHRVRRRLKRERAAAALQANGSREGFGGSYFDTPNSDQASCAGITESMQGLRLSASTDDISYPAVPNNVPVINSHSNRFKHQIYVPQVHMSSLPLSPIPLASIPIHGGMNISMPMVMDNVMSPKHNFVMLPPLESRMYVPVRFSPPYPMHDMLGVVPVPLPYPPYPSLTSHQMSMAIPQQYPHGPHSRPNANVK